LAQAIGLCSIRQSNLPLAGRTMYELFELISIIQVVDAYLLKVTGDCRR
jgi:hypothetical protein